MEILVGRVSQEAKVNTTKSDKQVVNFSVAVNDSYKPKGSSEVKKVVRYFKCAYWLNADIAKHLTKGTLVELCGRIDVDAYKDMQGEAKASLTMHVNNIKLHGKPKGDGESKPATAAQPATQTEQAELVDDLPF